MTENMQKATVIETKEGFRVGDIVTRHGNDRHRVSEIFDSHFIQVETISDCDFAKVGEKENNLSARFDFPDELLVDGSFSRSAIFGPPRTVHYVGFRDDRYWSAFQLFGGPRMIHRRWDRRAQRDIGPDDVVIFADGDETQPLARWPGDDLDEGLL